MSLEVQPQLGKRDPLAGRIPVSVVTGFLGSGKTTLINRLLKRPDMNRVAVIVNELGEIGIDNELVEVSSEQMMLLNNGCLCCVLRGDLEETMRDLFIKRRNGEIIDFDRIVIETTGLADPAPVMQTLMTDTMLEEQYRLDCVVTLVDAVNGLGQIATLAEPVKQVALADRLVITKADLADGEKLSELEAKLRELNPPAPIKRALNGEIDLPFLVDVGLRDVKGKLEDIARWLGDDEHEHDHAHAEEQREGYHVGHRHDTAITSFVLRFERPFPWPVFTQCMDVLTALRGPDLLRVKGLVNVEGRSGPMVVQGVQHLFHPPVELAAWPSADHSSRLVFITRGIPRENVANLFGAIGAVQGQVKG